MKNTQLTHDQANTLIDLVQDQILINRVYLRETPLYKSYIGVLTHLRHIRGKLQRMEAQTEPVTSVLLADDMENVALYNTFAL